MAAIVLESIMNKNNFLLQAALSYAVSGKPVFPCRVKDKAPLIPGGFKAASKDPEQIHSWWNKWPDALIGMPTGEGTGIFVVDVDIDPARGVDGEQSLSNLVARYGGLPDTKNIRTRRGGRHMYFTMEPGIGNSTGKYGIGLDIRGEGGYVIVPPSPGYTVICNKAPAKAPDWLIKLLVKPTRETKQSSTLPPVNIDGTQYGKAAFAGLIGQMRSAVDGNWNDTLNTVAFRFGQLVAGGELPDAAGEQLKQAARETGTAKPGDETRLQRTFRSGFESGLKNTDSAPRQETSKPPIVEATVNTVKASNFIIKAVDWLWFGYLATGKLHILCGRPGCGKTTVALKLSSTITTGEKWPDGSTSEPGNVVVWSGEDDPADTLIPRLVLSGAKTDHVYFVRGITDIDGHREFDPSTDIEPLRREIRRIGNVRLLIIDPLVSIIRGDDHKNGTVRRSLQPLADLAAAEDVAVLGVTHFSKNSIGKDPVDRVTGSLAYGAAARIVLVATKNEEDGTHVFCRAKSNIGADSDGFEYELKQESLPDHPEITASYVEWGKAIEGEARDILAQAEWTEADSTGSGALGEAMRFILDILNGEPVSANNVKEEAEAVGISEKTLRRAREALKVNVSRDGFGKGGKSVWSLPKPDGSNTPKIHTCPENPILAQENLLGKYEKFGQVCRPEARQEMELP